METALNEEKENVPPTSFVQGGKNSRGIKNSLSQTVPRQRKPLVDINSNQRKEVDENHHDHELKSKRKLIHHSAPQLGDTNNRLSKVVTTVKTKDTKRDWSFKETLEDCLDICKQLSIDLPSVCSTPLQLFEYLEKEGMLNPEVLKLYAPNREIKTLNMTPSYAGHLNSLGLFVESKLPPKLCTSPLYHGYQSLVALDLTNIAIGDDELRYLIKLGSLQALGLSGTNITSKGLKYLSIHAKFVCRLVCMKICYIPVLDDKALEFVTAFTSLQELDLLGTTCSLQGLVSFTKKCPVAKLRTPVEVYEQLTTLQEKFSKESKLVKRADDISQLSKTQITEQLKIFRKHYHNFIANDNPSILLAQLIERRSI